MIEFGETLRKAREAKGLSTGDIAQATHMMVQMVEDLERENFSKIAAPIYGRGFVKLYCETVGIDPKPLIAEFMDIFNGNRPPTIRMRSHEPAHVAAPPPPVPETFTEQPTPEEATAPVEPQPDPAPASVREEATAPEPDTPSEKRVPVQDTFSEPPPSRSLFSLEQESVPRTTFSDELPFPDPEPAFAPRKPSRYAAPMPIDNKTSRMPSISIPPAAWRLLALGVVAIAILWLLLAGARALYRATMTAPEQGGNAPAQVTSGRSEQAPEPAIPDAKRTPMSIPPLYID